MPFSWYYPKPVSIGAQEKAQAMYEQEIAQRAALLLRLGYAQDHAVMRLRANVAWDFELHGKPKHLDTVETIVKRVYAHHGAAGGGPPSLEQSGR